MNLNLTALFTLLALLAMPFAKPVTALLLVGTASMIGTYAYGDVDSEGLKILPGALLALVYCASLLARDAYLLRLPRSRLLGQRWIVPFLIYAVFISIAAPPILGSSVQVIQPGLVAEDFRGTSPLQWTSSSIAQLAYLFFAAILMRAAASATLKNGFDLARPVRWQLILATAFGLLVAVEAALGAAGISIDVFSWIMGPSFTEPRVDRYALDAVFGYGIRRAQAIFGEPSYFSTFMTGACGAAFIYARSKPTLRTLMSLLTIMVALVISFSTTAIAGLAIVCLLAAFVPLGARKMTSATMLRRMIFFVLFAAVAVGAVVAVLSSDNLFEYLFGKLSNVDGYEQGNYSSGAERLYWDTTAALAFLQSYGFGIGAGATRASSFLLNIAASYGLPGTVALLAVIFTLFRSLFRKRPYREDVNMRAAIIMWLGWIIGFAIAVPDGVSFFYLWIHLGFILAALATEQKLDLRRMHCRQGPGVEVTSIQPA